MNRISILLVEDYADTRAFIQLMLEDAGFDVITKEDGAEALEFLAQTRPSIVLTDLMMPNVSGLELIERMRNKAELADIPIIAMTAYGSGPIREAKQAGANAILRKPASSELIASTVRQLLSPSAS